MRIIDSNKHGAYKDMPENWAVDKNNSKEKNKNGIDSSDGEEINLLTPVPELEDSKEQDEEEIKQANKYKYI